MFDSRVCETMSEIGKIFDVSEDIRAIGVRDSCATFTPSQTPLTLIKLGVNSFVLLHTICTSFLQRRMPYT